MAETLLARAQGYLATARLAADAGHPAPAYENARSAAELAAKAMLGASGIRFGKDHNVAPDLVRAGLWPGGDLGKRLSRFLSDATRGVYGIAEPVRPAEAERAIRLAGNVLEAARTVLH
jgi:HEPN domain-containing protein